MQETANLIQEFLKQKTFAVVGSFKNEEKVAYKIFKMLTSYGYTVYPVNPNIKQVDNTKCYPSVEEIPDKIDVLILVTPPEVSLKIVQQALHLGINMVWLQPGADNPNVINFCKENKIKVIYNTCIMMNIKNAP